MKVVLLQDVANVGKKYDVKEVSDGYGTNYLVPKRMAKEGTPANLEWAEAKRSEMEAERAAKAEALRANLSKLEDAVVEISAKANDKGHLFASIHKEDILKGAEEQVGVEIPPELLELDEPIKEAGERKLTVSAGDERGTLVVNVSASDE